MGTVAPLARIGCSWGAWAPCNRTALPLLPDPKRALCTLQDTRCLSRSCVFTEAWLLPLGFHSRLLCPLPPLTLAPRRPCPGSCPLRLGAREQPLTRCGPSPPRLCSPIPMCRGARGGLCHQLLPRGQLSTRFSMPWGRETRCAPLPLRLALALGPHRLCPPSLAPQLCLLAHPSPADHGSTSHPFPAPPRLLSCPPSLS